MRTTRDVGSAFAGDTVGNQARRDADRGRDRGASVTRDLAATA